MKAKGFHIYLTGEQALTLAKVLANIGGNPEGPRGIVTAIDKKLTARGVDYEACSHRMTGDVYFVD